jgi:DNA (cytosine-5)-methyltransferase 1
MTYKPLTEDRGEELLTLYREDFHAKTLAQQEKAQELTVNDQVCGNTWQGSLARLDPDTLLWRTAQCSLLEDLELSLQTFPRWGLMQNGALYQLPTLVQTISAKESGLEPNNETFFHTPNTTGMDGGSNSRKALKKRLDWPTPTASQARSEGMILQMRKLVENGMTTTQEAEAMISGSLTPKRMTQWPTPNASRGGSWRSDGQISMIAKNVETYEEYLMLTKGSCKSKLNKYWPTPLSTEHKANRQTRENHQNGLTQAVLSTETGGQLNPTWVEWLMGWPLGWTDLKPLVMDKSLYVQQQLGNS